MQPRARIFTMNPTSIGIDYGTNSVRALAVDLVTGEEIAEAVFEYPSGEAGILLSPTDPNLARQRPSDYARGLISVVRSVLATVDAASVVGLAVDTTGSSPLPVDANGVALADHPGFADELDAQCWLWKDHTAHEEAEEITELARRRGKPYLAKCGGIYSSEWFWSKILHCQRSSPEVFASAHSWVECCDYVTGLLVGKSRPGSVPRSLCAAGHKAMFAEEWGGLPSAEFLSELSPPLAELRNRLYAHAQPSDQLAGGVSDSVASQTGLRAGTPVAVGGFDAHFGAVGSGVSVGTLVKIMGTSTCDCMVHPGGEPLADIPGVCGIVPGSILPGSIGIEAGQSAVGDLFNWFCRFSGRSHESLTDEASRLRPGQSGLLALDWNNGNRTVLVDPRLSGLMIGQSLHTKPAEVYRALIEATAFGARTIIERIREHGVTIDQVVACGGIADKSPLVMQIYADVLNMPIKIAASAQTCALGGAIFGSVVGGHFSRVEEAQAALVRHKPERFLPTSESVAAYQTLYELYRGLHDSFGGVRQTDLGPVMKQLLTIRERANG